MDDLEFETLTSAEFKNYRQTHQEKNFLLIDVRQASEYEQGHIPGAKLMPLSEVETRLFSLPSNRDLIFYYRLRDPIHNFGNMVAENFFHKEPD